MVGAPGDIETVAQAAQQIQRLPRLQAGHGLCALTHHLINQGQPVPIPVTDGDRAAEELPLQPDIHKLPRRGDGAGIASEAHLPHLCRQRLIPRDGIHPLLHHPSASCQTIFPPTMVSLHTPYSSIPAKGVARPMDWNSSGSTR